MAALNEAEAVSEMINLKTKLEQNLQNIREEKETIQQKIRSTQENKQEVRKLKAAEFQRLYKLKIELSDVHKQVSIYARHIADSGRRLENLEHKIFDRIKMPELQDRMVKIRDATQNAINFYSEDSLQLELVKRNNINREKRVELTRVAEDCSQLRKALEKEKMEKEKARLAAIELARQEEERKRKFEEDRVKMERNRQREQFLQQRVSAQEGGPQIQLQPFRRVVFNTCSPEPASLQESSGISPSSNGTESFCQNLSKEKPSLSALPSSLSQFLRW